MPSPRTTRSNPTLILPTGHPECNLRDQESFRTVYQREGSGRFGEAEQLPIHILNQTFESLDREGPPQSPTLRPQSAPDASNLAKETDPHTSEQLRCMIAQEVRRKCAKRYHEVTQQAVKNALTDLFITDTAEIEKGMKKAFYCYIVNILATLAEKGTLGEVSDRSIERWTQSASFMDAFTRRALTSSRFTQPLANFVKSRLEQTAKEWHIPAKAEAVPPPELSDPWPQPPFLFPSSDEEAHDKHRRARRKAQSSKANYFEKGRENPDLYSPASSD